MKRLSVILFIFMVIIVTACGGNKGVKWGSFDVSLTNQKADAQQWQAVVLIKNNTNGTVPLQYNGTVQHTLRISRDGKEIYKQVFNPVKEPLIHNLTPNTYREHLVIWRYVDQEGKNVSPGTYQARVEVHAITAGVEGAPQALTVGVIVK